MKPIQRLSTPAITTFFLLTIIQGYVFFFLPPLSYPWSYIKIIAGSKSCQTAKQNAVQDFNNGNYQIVEQGLQDRPRHRLPSANKKSKQNIIKFIPGGCVVSDEVKCYNEQMLLLLKRKFGKDLYWRITTESP